MTEYISNESVVGSAESIISSVGTDSKIDPLSACFPHCIVWTPLPVLSWLAPYVGHLGICRDDGVILDFAGPYFVNVDNFAFGATARYTQLNKLQCCVSFQFGNETSALNSDRTQVDASGSWDDALRSTMQQFQHMSYSLFTCNCHSFVASCLNRLTFRGQSNWNVIKVVLLILFEGQWVDKGAILRSLAPFVFVMCLGMYLAGWAFLTGWAIFNLILTGWFLMGTYLLRGLIRC